MESKVQLPSSHEHPLVPYFHLPSDINSCHKCSKPVSSFDDYVFSCKKCNYYFHCSCVLQFLKQINHVSHPQHILTMSDYDPNHKRTFRCSLCHQSFDKISIPHFSCGRCEIFCIDIFCALNIPTVILENKNNDPRLCHRQPMERTKFVWGSKEAAHIKNHCYICQTKLWKKRSGLDESSDPIYTCKICNQFFHMPCIELSTKIRHPFHLRHVLNLTVSLLGKSCHKCGKLCFNFVFQCSNAGCHYWLCVQCSFPIPNVRSTIRYQNHDHLLSLVEKPEAENIRCNSPYGYCKQSVVSNELTHTERYRFCCQSCNFSLHLLCGPLPCVIKHNCHIHPLALVDSMVEDDSGEYYCDACETQRDPRICVYYCAECKYIAHVNCVVSEVVRVLQGDPTNFELRAVGQMNQKLKIESYEKEEEGQMNQKLKNESYEKEEEEAEPTTLLYLFTLVGKRLNIIRDHHREEEEGEDLEPEEKKHYIMVSNIMNKIIGRKQNVRNELSTNRGHEEQPQSAETKIQRLISSYDSDKNFEELIQKLNNFDYGTRWSEVTADELKMKIENVEGGYTIPCNLAHVLKGVVDKFGDIRGDQSKSSGKELTSVLVFLLCQLVYKMSTVIVVDVTEDVLGDWYTCFRFLKSEGLKVDFINSGLQQIVRAYFGLQTRRDETKRDEQISCFLQQIEEEEAKLKRWKEKLESCKTQKRTERRRHTSDSETTILMKQCLDEASRLEWKYAAYCLDFM